MKSLLLLGTLGAATALAQQNLVQDPGFELGGSAWTFQANAPATDEDGRFAVLPEAARTGTAGGQVVIDTAYPASNNWYLQLQVPRWSVKPGTRYSVSFWARGTSATVQMGFPPAP